MAHRPKRLDGSYALMVAGPGIPAGGLDGQFAKKNSDADYDIVWARVSFENLQGIPSDNDALATVLGQKSDVSHTHDTRYYKQDQTYTQSEVNALLAGKSDVGHTHDDRYYTETEVDALLVDYYTEAEVDALFGDLMECFPVAVSDETTAITTGDSKIVFHCPYTGVILDVYTGLSTVSSSGDVTVDIELAGTSIFDTLPVIQSGEETSLTGTQAVMDGAAPVACTKGQKIVINIDTAGTGAKGLKAYLYIRR